MARNYVFTLNNPEYQLKFEDCPLVRYASWQMEIGEEGTVHYQGYIELTRQTRIPQLKEMGNFMLESAHFEQRQGTREQARDYTRKEESRIEGPWEYGEWTAGGQGRRTDVTGLKKLIDDGKSILDIWDAEPLHFLKFNRGIMTIMNYKQAKRNWMPEVIVCIGRPGCGKTAYCHEQAPDLYMKQRSDWWDGYIGQPDILFDDFYGWMRTDEMLRICDRYAHMVQTKGGQTQLVCKRVFITSNAWPVNWYKTWVTGKLPFEAFARRVSRWIYWDADGERQEVTSWSDFKELAENDGFDTQLKDLNSNTL